MTSVVPRGLCNRDRRCLLLLGRSHSTVMNTPTSIGRFQILQRLDSGGMGVVYKAYDPQIQQEVCIKQLLESADSEELRRRFLREARAAGRLRNRHPNI